MKLTYIFYHQSILDCSEANEGFYVKCGYKRAGLEMAHYYDPPSGSSGGNVKQREGAPASKV